MLQAGTTGTKSCTQAMKGLSVYHGMGHVVSFVFANLQVIVEGHPQRFFPLHVEGKARFSQVVKSFSRVPGTADGSSQIEGHVTKDRNTFGNLMLLLI